MVNFPTVKLLGTIYGNWRAGTYRFRYILVKGRLEL